MRASIVALTLFWALLSPVFGSPLSQPRMLGKPDVQYLEIATPERVAKAKEIVNKQYQEAAERMAQGLPEKTATSAAGPGGFVKDIQAPRVDKKTFDTAYHIFKDWCDSEQGGVSPFSHQYMDFGDVRIAICNWGLWNPCHGSEVEAAWEALDLVCPEEGSDAKDDMTVSTGMWYRGAWLKGYFRSSCTTGDLCNGDRTGIACRNEG
ncbi:hypothetical protein PG993_012642 [Apiospora rasikravindrae]|uniref:Uncharacterized protein n=1 Tax=Apiospora rasikravindrae TaxID=990691 RepID=A0ABR1S4T5_9PEZI